MKGIYEGDEHGFSLVEVMVSLVIFLVASMGLLPLLMTNMQANQGNRLHAQARHLISEVMAQLQTVDYDILPLTDGEAIRVGDVEVRQRIERDTPSGDQSRITLTAVWQQRGQNHRYQLQTIRSAP